MKLKCMYCDELIDHSWDHPDCTKKRFEEMKKNDQGVPLVCPCNIPDGYEAIDISPNPNGSNPIFIKIKKNR